MGVEEEEEAATFRRRKNRVASTVGGYRMAERRGLFSIASSYIRGGGKKRIAL